MRDILTKYLTLPGKTEPSLTIFDHSNDVLQVMIYLLQNNRVPQPNLLKLAALLHDVGKIEQHFDGERWIHTPYTERYLEPLLSDLGFRQLANTAGVDFAKIDESSFRKELVESRELLSYACESHHAPASSPSKLRHSKSIILVAVADMIASALEKGYTGQIDNLLKASPYGQSIYNFVETLVHEDGLENLTDTLSRAVHRVELPAQYVEDELLVNAAFTQLGDEAKKAEDISILAQRGQTVWVTGDGGRVENLLRSLTLSPASLYELLYGKAIYNTILNRLPPVGATQIDSNKFILVNEDIARQYATSLMLRRSVRQLIERHDISADEISRIMTGRGLGIAARLRAIDGRLQYSLTGQTATYFYSDWRYTPEKLFEIAVLETESVKAYAYLKNPSTYVSESVPSSRDFEAYEEVVILHPRADMALLPVKEIDGLRVLAPEVLLAELIETSEEVSACDAIALVVAQRGRLDWTEMATQLERRKLIRVGGCLFEIINAEAGFEVVSLDFIQSLSARVSVSLDEKPYPFPLRVAAGDKKETKQGRLGSHTEKIEAISPDFKAIAIKWGIEWRLPNRLVHKVLADIGIVHE